MIDDLFAFVIKMPLLHRLSGAHTPRTFALISKKFAGVRLILELDIELLTRELWDSPSSPAVFRDDIVFCFLLYQRWIYRVDKKRVNEFG